MERSQAEHKAVLRRFVRKSVVHGYLGGRLRENGNRESNTERNIRLSKAYAINPAVSIRTSCQQKNAAMDSWPTFCKDYKLKITFKIV